MLSTLETAAVAPTPVATPAVTGLASYYGSNRTLASNVGRALAGRKHVTIPFAGSLTEGLAIKARSLVVGDAHRHLINLFTVAADPVLGPQLYRELRRLPFHPDVLAAAQERCRFVEGRHGDGLFGSSLVPGPDDAGRLAWAVDYFVTSWFGQGGRSGTKAEFRGPMSVRFDAGGGDSCRRYRSAVASIPAWRQAVLSRCTFFAGDFRQLLAKVRDRDDCGLYCDPPFPGPGDAYRHRFTPADHRDLRDRLAPLRRTRVVVRYYSHPLVEELYPRSAWDWQAFDGRDQHNAGDKPELLITNRLASDAGSEAA